MTGDRSRTYKRAFWSLADQGIVSIGNFATTIQLARAIPTSDYGIFAIVLSINFAFQLICGSLLLYPYAVRRNSLDGAHAGTFLAATSRILVVLAGTLSIIMALGLWLSGKGHLALAAAAMYFAWQYHERLRRCLHAEFRFATSLKGDVTAYVCIVLGVALMGHYQELSLQTALYAMAAGFSVGAVVHRLQLEIAKTSWATAVTEARTLMNLGKWALLNEQIAFFRIQSIPWALLLWNGPVTTAYYQAAVNIANFTNPLIIGLSSTIPQIVAEARAHHGVGAALVAARRYALVGLIPLLGFCVIAFIGTDFILQLLYGENSPYRDLVPDVRILLIAWVAYYVSQIMVQTLLGMQAMQAASRINAFSLVFVLCGLVLIIPYGVTGACIAIALGNLSRVPLAAFGIYHEFRKGDGAPAPASPMPGRQPAAPRGPQTVSPAIMTASNAKNLPAWLSSKMNLPGVLSPAHVPPHRFQELPMRHSTGFADIYLVALALLLAGYAILGKGFAYIGIGPLFVGEIVLIAGAFMMLRIGSFLGLHSTIPALLLAALIIWVGLRTFPFVGAYGFDALRDSVIAIYGAFALIVVALLLEDTRRLERIIRYYAAFTAAFLLLAPLTFAASWNLLEYLPNVPGHQVPIISLRAGEVAVHLAGVAVFTIFGFARITPWRVFAAVILFALIAATSRSAMLSAIVSIGLGAVLAGKLRQLALAGLACLVAFAAIYAVEVQFTQFIEPETTLERKLSAQQIVENASSIFSESGSQTEETKQWRLEWWQLIINDTIFGPHFWQGRGFGINLSIADGFTNAHLDEAPLRSPHNAHMTFLARAGVPGLCLWIALIASWLFMMLRELLRAKAYGHDQVYGVLAFVLCYETAMLINASFDVALEGPMQGIWFWCVFGMGIGVTMLHRARCADVDQARAKATARPVAIRKSRLQQPGPT